MQFSDGLTHVLNYKEPEYIELWRIYKDLYNHEVELRHYYDGRIGQTFTIMSAIAGLIIFGLDNIKKVEGNKELLIAVLLLTMVVFLFQLYVLFKAYFSIKYRYMDFPVNMIEDDIKQRLLEMTNETDIESKMKEYIAGMLFRTYKKCAEKYYETNIEKRKYHHILNIFTYINFILLIFQNFILIIN